MQANQLEPPVERVGNAVFGEKHGLPGLLDDPPVGELCCIANRLASGERNHHAAVAGIAVVDNDWLSAKSAGQNWASSRSVSTETCLLPRDILAGRQPMLLLRLSAASRRCCRLLSRWRAALPPSSSAAICRRRMKSARSIPGNTTKDQVVKILGTPSSVGVFNDKYWYYISPRTKQFAFFDPKVLDQQVYVVDFNDDGVVKAVDHKTLKDGQEIVPVARATPAPGRELTFLEQMIGNLGKFNGSSGGAPRAAAAAANPGPNPQSQE